jgi:hypothetical protein
MMLLGFHLNFFKIQMNNYVNFYVILMTFDCDFQELTSTFEIGFQIEAMRKMKINLNLFQTEKNSVILHLSNEITRCQLLD